MFNKLFLRLNFYFLKYSKKVHLCFKPGAVIYSFLGFFFSWSFSCCRSSWRALGLCGDLFNYKSWCWNRCRWTCIGCLFNFFLFLCCLFFWSWWCTLCNWEIFFLLCLISGLCSSCSSKCSIMVFLSFFIFSS